MIKRKPISRDDDTLTIIEDAAHIPDRDQSFGVDHKQFPGDATPGSDWSGDEEDEIKGERDPTRDAYDELTHVDHITRPEGIKAPRRSPTPAPMAAARSGDVLSGLNDDELRERAAALGVPGRERMTRIQLAQAVRGAAHHV